MEEIMTVTVDITDSYEVRGKTAGANMVIFTARAEGALFCGETVHEGVDTQYTTAEGFCLSARYMLEGRDSSDERCRVFIENNGSSMDDCRPRIITDSPALSFLETADLRAKVEGRDGGVTVRIFIAGQPDL